MPSLRQPDIAILFTLFALVDPRDVLRHLFQPVPLRINRHLQVIVISVVHRLNREETWILLSDVELRDENDRPRGIEVSPGGNLQPDFLLFHCVLKLKLKL